MYAARVGVDTAVPPQTIHGNRRDRSPCIPDNMMHGHEHGIFSKYCDT